MTRAKGGVPTPPPMQDIPQPELGIPPPAVQLALEFMMPLDDDKDLLDTIHDESLICYRSIDNGELVPGQA
jgi:hypothetical protein